MSPPHLSFDIQVEIIKRLPVKSLIQFRSVCKTWKSLIDSSHFIAGYNFRHDQSEHLLVRYKVGDRKKTEVKYVCFVDDDTFPQQKLDLTVPPLVQVTIPIGSSHGLLCLIGYLRETQGSCLTSETFVVVIWNPAIRKSISVAVPYVVRPLFDCAIGFGVCPDTKDPKLVKITYIHDYTKMESISCISQVMVFTLSSGEWTPSRSNQLPRKSIQFTCNQTVIGQFIYWRAYDWSDVDGEPRNLIMSFDMSTEEFTEIDLPDSLAYVKVSQMDVSRIRESLVLIEYIQSTLNKQVCDVWMMEHGDPKVFMKLFTINASVSRTLEFRKNGEPIVEMQNNHRDFFTPSALVVYDPCSKHIMDLGIPGHRHSSFANSYTESLLLLDHDDGHIVRCEAVKR